jgi:hypothetical protein
MNDTWFEILISILLGLCISVLIWYIFLYNNKYIGPNSNDICKNIYIDKNNKKYKWAPYTCICPIDLSMNKLHDKNFKQSH